MRTGAPCGQCSFREALTWGQACQLRDAPLAADARVAATRATAMRVGRVPRRQCDPRDPLCVGAMGRRDLQRPAAPGAVAGARQARRRIGTVASLDVKDVVPHALPHYWSISKKMQPGVDPVRPSDNQTASRARWAGNPGGGGVLTGLGGALCVRLVCAIWSARGSNPRRGAWTQSANTVRTRVHRRSAGGARPRGAGCRGGHGRLGRRRPGARAAR